MRRSIISSVPRTLCRLAARARARVLLAREWPERVVEIRLVHAFPIAALAAALAAYVAWPGSATAIVAGALATALAATFWAIRAQVLGLTAERRLTYAPLQVGDEIEESLTLINAAWLPIVVRLDDASTLPGYGLTSIQAVGAHSSRAWRIRAVCSRRGIATLGPWSATWQDPFGVFEAQVRFGHRQEVVVVPPLARAALALTPRRARRGDRAALRQPLRADSVQAATVREYGFGDPLHRIHWPTSARRQSLFVKQLDPEAASDVWLVPDFGRAALGPESLDEDAPLERLVLLTVAAAQELLAQRLRLGLAYAIGAPVVVPARPGKGHLWPILRALAPVQATAIGFSEVLAELTTVIPARARLIVVSADVDADWAARAAAVGRIGGLDLILMDTDREARRAQRVVEALRQRGWTAQAIAAAEVQPLLGAYGPLRRWEFRALGTGRIVTQQTPRSGAELERQPG